MQEAITRLASAQEARNQPSDLPTNLKGPAHCGLKDDPDAALVNSFRAGDALAFDLLVRRHERQLLIVALRITRNREDAEDVVQDSLLNAFKHLNSFRGECRVLSWLTRITINQALMAMRGKSRKTTSLDDHFENEEVITCEANSGGYTPEQFCSQLEFERQLFDWTAGMKVESRQVLELRAMGLRQDEIAQILGLSLSAAKSRVFRARRELRRRIDRNIRSASAPRARPNSKRLLPEAPITNRRKYDGDQLSVWLPGSLHMSDSSGHAQNVV